MKQARSLLFLSGTSFFLLMLSLSAHLLNWRVVGEPGAQPVPWLPAAFRILLLSGLTGTLLANGLLILRRSRPLGILLVPPGAAFLLYLPVLSLTLLMLV